MIVVADASVALKWFFTERPGEEAVEDATTVLRAVGSGELQLIQPPHFLAEIAAVLCRETPETAERDLDDLRQVEWRASDDAPDYSLAMQISARLGHHLFDTLYHAVALNRPGAVLLTADRRYYQKARASYDSIELLGDFMREI